MSTSTTTPSVEAKVELVKCPIDASSKSLFHAWFDYSRAKELAAVPDTTPFFWATRVSDGAKVPVTEFNRSRPEEDFSKTFDCDKAAILANSYVGIVSGGKISNGKASQVEIAKEVIQKLNTPSSLMPPRRESTQFGPVPQWKQQQYTDKLRSLLLLDIVSLPLSTPPTTTKSTD